MNMKERKKGPVRRGGARGRPPARKEGEGSTPVKKRDERGDQNWTKKFEDGDFDDFFDAPPGEDEMEESLGEEKGSEDDEEKS